MKKFFLPTLSSLFALGALLLLPGYQNVKNQNSFPAPIEKPALVLYANISSSGIYDQAFDSGNTASTIAETAARICSFRSSDQKTQNLSRQSAENLLNNKILTGFFKAYEIFFFFHDVKSFAVILNGEFSVKKIAESMVNPEFSLNDKSFSVEINAPLPLGSIFLYCSADRVILGPLEKSQELIEKTYNNTNLLTEEFQVFSRMVRARPALAAEVSIQSLEKNLENFSINHIVDGLKHLRFIAAGQMTKIQMFVPDSTRREALFEVIEKYLAQEDSILKELGRFNIEANGNSLFVETPASQELEKQISKISTAFLLHFFVRAEKNTTQLSSCEIND